jgi:hypothetical protein
MFTYLSLAQSIITLMLTHSISALSDCSTVVSIYLQMGGYISDADCCKIHGVTCDESRNVIKLEWIGQQLSGSIPKEIGNLMNLRIL